MYFVNEYDVFTIGEHNVLLNYISGACDLISNDVLFAVENKRFDLLSNDEKKLLIKRGYLFKSDETYKDYVKQVEGKLEEEDRLSPPNFLIIPTYACNLKCTYCFESAYSIEHKKVCSNWLELAFQFILYVVKRYASILPNNKTFDPQLIVVTLMGGEPLLTQNYSVVERIVSFVERNGFSYNIITNGVNISNYISLFKKVKPQSVQITLDGTQSIHDSRRINKDGSGTFETIVANIHKLTMYNIPVHIRMNIDKNNIGCIDSFANYIEEEFKNNRYCIPYVYPMQDGGCYYENEILDEKNIILEIARFKSVGANLGHIRCLFHGSSIIRAIQKNQRIKLKIRNCAANKKQYILDSYGNTYKCWFGVGNENFSIGSYLDFSTYENKLDQQWTNRTVSTLSKCTTCKYRFLCGGGCLSHVYKGNSDIEQSRCVDFYELIKLQLSQLLKEVLIQHD